MNGGNFPPGDVMLAAAFLGGISFIQIAILIVVVAAVVGIVFVALRQFGIQIPQFVVTIFWIVVCAVVAILAIKFIAELL